MFTVTTMSLVLLGLVIATAVWHFIKVVTKPDPERLYDLEFDRYSVLTNYGYPDSELDVDTIEEARDLAIAIRAKGYKAFIYDRDTGEYV